MIPEIGINHEGSLQVAKEMVTAAYRAGARLIKHQTHVVEDEMCQVARGVIPGNSTDSIYDIMARCALDEEQERELKEYTESLGMVFLSTPFSRAAAERLERMGVHAYKIGSGELNNYPLIEHIAEFGKPMIVSTGMDDNACIAAIAMGADLVERHFTDSMERTGPDIICSMDEAACEELIQAAKEIPQMRGGKKGALPEEQVTIDFAFATVVTIAPIKRGEHFTKDNLWVKRPGTGDILAEEYNSLLGKCAAVDIDTDVQLTYEMVR